MTHSLGADPFFSFHFVRIEERRVSDARIACALETDLADANLRVPSVGSLEPGNLCESKVLPGKQNYIRAYLFCFYVRGVYFYGLQN